MSDAFIPRPTPCAPHLAIAFDKFGEMLAVGGADCVQIWRAERIYRRVAFLWSLPRGISLRTCDFANIPESLALKFHPDRWHLCAAIDSAVWRVANWS